MLLFSYKKEIEIQSVRNALVVVVVVVMVLVVVVVLVVEHNGGSLVLRKDYHEGLCKWGETQMIVGVYDLDLVENLRV